MNIKQAIAKVVERENLSEAEMTLVFGEIMSGGASKSHAIEVLCNHYGVSPAEAVAFGDGPNDIDMLAAVAQSYAMANAEEEVKRAAAHTISWSNVESGVARALAQLVLGTDSL